MSDRPHITVIGAGLIGLSTADALLRRGARVTLVEARMPMGGASFANSGMIHPSQACSWSGSANAAEADAAVFGLAMRSRELLAARMEALGLVGMQARRAGCYQIFETETLAEAAQARLADRGIAVEAVAADALPLDRPGLYFPEDRSGDAQLYGRALTGDLEARGVSALTGAARLGVEEGQAVAFVGNARLDADGIVVACGWETETLLGALGLSLGIAPVRGWALDHDRPRGLALSDVPIMDAHTRSALTVFENRIRLSGTWGEETPELLAARWRILWPDLFDGLGEPSLTWSGLRPVSPLGRPFIGPTPILGLWVNAGHGHMGWTLCAGSGELMAQIIVEGRTAPAFALPQRMDVTCPHGIAV